MPPVDSGSPTWGKIAVGAGLGLVTLVCAGAIDNRLPSAVAVVTLVVFAAVLILAARRQ